MKYTAALVLGLFLLVASVATEAQPAGTAYRVGIVMTTAPVSDLPGPEPAHPAVRAFVHGLRGLGYVEDRNLILERRSAEGRWDRLPAIVSELLSLNPDVIVSVSNSVTRERRR